MQGTAFRAVVATALASPKLASPVYAWLAERAVAYVELGSARPRRCVAR